jgi:DHA1 family tetracycline resistance protein-like MFS transporter
MRTSPFHRFSPLPILFLVVFVDMVGFGIVVPVLPLYTERFGASPITIGALLAVYSGMGFIFAPLVGLLADRFGRRKILLLSTIGQATGFFIMGAAKSVFWLFVARTIDGIFGANTSAAQAYVADVTPSEKRSRALGWLGAAFGLGFICGPLLGGILSRVSLGAPFYFASALAAANALLIFFVLPETLPPEAQTHPIRPNLLPGSDATQSRTIGSLIASYFLFMTGFAILTSFFAIFTEDRFGFDASQNGYIFAGVGAIGVIVQGGLLGPLVGRFGEKRLAAVGMALLAISIFSLPLTEQIPTFLLTGVGIAVGNALVNPTVSGLVSQTVDKYHQGRALGLMQSGASLGRCLGPILGGWLASNARHTLDFGKAPFWTSSAILLISLAVTTTVTAPSATLPKSVLPGED